jgi:transposase
VIKSSQSAKARLATVHLPPTPLTDAQWARIEPLIPDWTPRRGGRWRDHHEAISSISRWIHREKYGNWRGVYNRLQMWAVNGTWGRLFTALVAQADADEDLHWVISFDSAVVRATASNTPSYKANAARHISGSWQQEVIEQVDAEQPQFLQNDSTRVIEIWATGRGENIDSKEVNALQQKTANDASISLVETEETLRCTRNATECG